ncbi:flagellar basal body rod protein FlgC [Sulfoacidibacillus thermotolerans]|uniref:Flagellar basal-body rod protein FlgC n=1 Tax=Sulfoacidibacillus thermotolerans TaxID=1765684 RepID=A0A2U3DAA2_SULT2|nr:flagellar basal body rod protein FlgC [Sulfoacidibacillus thermotolerans]PWI58183.1 flagellar basal body rod protein FlgC [Sulfoacidibacillus thermotolerans]
MGLFDGMSISSSGLTANRTWLDVIANNIANANTTRTPQGGPYRAEEVVFSPIPNAGGFSSALTRASGAVGQGVQVAAVVQDPSPFKLVYDPSSPDAVNGYVQMPNVNIATQMVDMISASRAYEANVTAFNAAKTMDTQSISLGK